MRPYKFGPRSQPGRGWSVQKFHPDGQSRDVKPAIDWEVVPQPNPILKGDLYTQDGDLATTSIRLVFFLNKYLTIFRYDASGWFTQKTLDRHVQLSFSFRKIFEFELEVDGS